MKRLNLIKIWKHFFFYFLYFYASIFRPLSYFLYAIPYAQAPD